MRKKIYIELAIIWFMIGAILTYLGGLYGDFNKDVLIITSGIALKIYGIFLLSRAMRSKSKREVRK